MWNSESEDDEPPVVMDDGVRGAHPPYRVIGTNGAVYDIHPWHVVRDHNSAYPVLPKEWAHMCETGKHAFWNSGALLAKPSRQLMAKTIVVLRTTDDEPEYMWCVRMRLELPELARDGSRPSVGSEFLWLLSWREALAFMFKLSEDELFEHSSLVLQYEPVDLTILPEALPGARQITALRRWQDRAFVASLSAVTPSEDFEICSRWKDPRALRGQRRFPHWVVSVRRSPRWTSPPLVEALGLDLVGEVVEHAVGTYYLSANLLELVKVLDLRIVCRAFNASVCEGIVRASRKVRQLCTVLYLEDALVHAYAARAILTWAGISTFRAMDEAWHARHKLALTRREEVHIWMRLLFNKSARSRPPMAPKAFQSMVCVHGEAPKARSGYGTRRQSVKRVRFRLLVSQCHVAALEARGWTKDDAGEPWYLRDDLW